MPKSKNTRSIRSKSKKLQRKMSKPKNTVHSILKRKSESKQSNTKLLNKVNTLKNYPTKENLKTNPKRTILNYFNSKGKKYINTVVGLREMKINVEPVMEVYNYNPIEIFSKVLQAPKLNLPPLLINVLCEVFREFIFQLWDGVNTKSTLLLLSPINLLNQIYELFPNDNKTMSTKFQPCKLIINILDLMDDRLKLYPFVQLTGLYANKNTTEYLIFIHKCKSLEYNEKSYFLKPKTPLLIFYLPINTSMRTNIKYLFIYSHLERIELAKKPGKFDGLQFSDSKLINIIENFYLEKNDVNISLIRIDNDGLKYQLNKFLTNKSIHVQSQPIGSFIEKWVSNLLPVFMGTLNRNSDSSVYKILKNPLYDQQIWGIVDNFYSGNINQFKY